MELASGASISAGSTVLATAGWASEMLRAHGLDLPTLRLHATAGKTSPIVPAASSDVSDRSDGSVGSDGAGAGSFPSAGVWAKGCSFRLRLDGRLTIADGGFREEHDFGLESLICGTRFLPALSHFWRQTNLRFRSESFPSPREDACPVPNPNRLQAALTELAELLPALPPLRIEEAWAGFLDVTPDMLPVMDASALEGVTVMAGFSGHGLGLAPAAGRLGAALAMREEGADDEVQDFRLGRFRETWWIGPQSLV